MRLLSWIFRIIVIAFIVRLVLRALFPGARARRPRPTEPARVPERAGGALVRDPQCGTYVAQTRAVTVSGPDGPVYFCSDSCRDQWKAAHGRPARSA